MAHFVNQTCYLLEIYNYTPIHSDGRNIPMAIPKLGNKKLLPYELISQNTLTRKNHCIYQHT